jgi:hypothetical protein
MSLETFQSLPDKLILVRHAESLGNVDATTYSDTPDYEVRSCYGAVWGGYGGGQGCAASMLCAAEQSGFCSAPCDVVHCIIAGHCTAVHMRTWQRTTPPLVSARDGSTLPVQRSWSTPLHRSAAQCSGAMQCDADQVRAAPEVKLAAQTLGVAGILLHRTVQSVGRFGVCSA